jgi:hypothetical protein
MTISEHASVFFDLPVNPYESADDWKGPDVAYRVSTSWDDGREALDERLASLFAEKDASQLKAIVIGAWNGDDSTLSSEAIVAALAAQKGRLAGLKALFLGDITYEENEISWINQSDVSPLLTAYPGLEVLRVRGGNCLQFSKVRHDALRQLIVETGGLRRDVIREICRCDFPKLEHLELWLGIDNYGFDGGVEDLQPIFAGERFPSLRYLGLRNSEIADEIAAVVVNAPVLKQLDVLDLSNGTISDVGARSLLNMPAGLPLREVNVSHHFMSEEMVTRLEDTLECEVIATDGQDPNDEWRSVVVSE